MICKECKKETSLLKKRCEHCSSILENNEPEILNQNKSVNRRQYKITNFYGFILCVILLHKYVNSFVDPNATYIGAFIVVISFLLLYGSMYIFNIDITLCQKSLFIEFALINFLYFLVVVYYDRHLSYLFKYILISNSVYIISYLVTLIFKKFKLTLALSLTILIYANILFMLALSILMSLLILWKKNFINYPDDLSVELMDYQIVSFLFILFIILFNKSILKFGKRS